MRTTITLDDRLLARLKKRAAETGTSVSRLIEQAVRLLLQPQTRTRVRKQFQLVTFGSGGNLSRYNIDKASSLLETDDIERYGRR